MSSVISVSNSAATNYTAVSATQRRHRPDPVKMAEDLFSKLDSSGKGYIEQSDLESALSAATSGSSQTVTGSASASEIFSQLDGNGDGKVTQDELSTSIAKLAESLDSQFDQARVQGGMPPPPPPTDDAGFTQDELSSQLSEIGSSDPARASLVSKIVANFAQADSNQDGKVSFQEARAYDQSTSAATSSSAASDTSATSTATASEKTEAQIFRQIMELMRSYGGTGQDSQSVLSSLISTIA